MEDVDRSPRFALWLPVVVLWLVAAIPVAVWAGMFVHAVRASRFLGRWPAPGYPDPKALPVALQSERIEGFVTGAVVALVIWAGVALTRRRRWKFRYIAALAGLIVLWASWSVIARIDPGHIVKWYLG